MGVREARIFAERLGFTPTQIAELVTAVEEIERKLLRHRSPSAQLIVRVQPSGTTLEWAASSMRISNEDSRAMYIGPLPSTAGRATLPPQGRDPAIEGAGWRWLSKGPELILLGRPHPRETLSGDMAMVNRRGDKMRLAVADGLGHGPLAREASRRAVESLRATVALSLEEAVLAAHEQIATTRGATLGLAEVDLGTADSGYLLRARLNVSLPGLAPEVARELADAAHEVCPYSKATRGNIDVARRRRNAHK